MKEEYNLGSIFLAAFTIFMFVGITIFAVKDESKYIYECTDIQGKLIYCTYAVTNKGGMFGKTEDGRKITLTSYKKINKEDMKTQEEEDK